MLAHLDALLHDDGRSRAVSVRWIVALGVASGLLYGAVMGLYGVRPLQALYSALKVPILLGFSTLVCLPSFFVINTTIGLRSDFGAALRGILVAQGTVAMTLAALAPITVLGYVSSGVYEFALTLNGVMFATASVAGQIALAHHYRPLIAKDRRHRVMLRGWLGLYWFVTIQLAWVLRPFVGAIGLPTVFLRPNSWGNAYVEISRLLWGWLTR